MPRTDARHQFISSADFRDAMMDVQPILNEWLKSSYCLIGGLAVAYYVNPPVTVDIDFLAITTRAELMAMVSGVNAHSSAWRAHPIRFGMRRPGGTGFGIRLKREKPFAVVVDILSTDGDWFLGSAVQNSEEQRIQDGLFMHVVKAEDLVILKVLAGREKDLEDIADLEERLELNDDYIQGVLDKLAG